MSTEEFFTQGWLERIDAAIQDRDNNMLVVRVHRYGNPDRFGWHLVQFRKDWDAPGDIVRMRTFGLVGAEGDRKLRLALDLKRGMDPLGNLDRFTVYPGITLLVYLIEQIAPREWQQRMHAGDEDLLSKIKVFSTGSSQREGGVWRLPASVRSGA